MRYKVNIALKVPGTARHAQTLYFPLQKEIHPVYAVYRKPAALFVTAGLEENFQAFCRLLKKQEIVDRRLNWQFADGHLVVMGSNMITELKNVESLWFLYALEESARKQGGCVHFIAGRQVLLHMNGNWRFNHPRYASGSQRQNRPVTALYDANHELWRWLQTKNASEQIGKALFAPVLPNIKLMEILPSLASFNDAVRSYTHSATSNPLSLNSLFNHYQEPSFYAETDIDSIRHQFQVKNIITCTPANTPFTSLYNGKVLQLSSLPNEGIAVGLLRRHKSLFLVNSNGEKVKIKPISNGKSMQP